MAVQELYNYLLDEYGGRKCWISEIAEHFQISRSDANTLTIALGFKRGVCKSHKSLVEFSNNPDVKRVLGRIK